MQRRAPARVVPGDAGDVASASVDGCGAWGETRTLTGSPLPDFESPPTAGARSARRPARTGFGAWGETRTLTGSPLPDFESGASTNFATQAGGGMRMPCGARQCSEGSARGQCGPETLRRGACGVVCRARYSTRRTSSLVHHARHALHRRAHLAAQPGRDRGTGGLVRNTGSDRPLPGVSSMGGVTGYRGETGHYVRVGGV